MWAFGQVMWCLITQCHPPEGPIPEKVENIPENPSPDDDYEIGRDVDDGKHDIGRPPEPPRRAQPPRRAKKMPTASHVENAKTAKATVRTGPAKKRKQAIEGARTPKHIGGDGRPKWSYGNYICRDDNERFCKVDPQLRAIVMRCMMDEPRDRPNMSEIRQTIDGKLFGVRDINDPDHAKLADDMRCLYHEPSPPEMQPEERLSRVCSHIVQFQIIMIVDTLRSVVSRPGH